MTFSTSSAAEFIQHHRMLASSIIHHHRRLHGRKEQPISIVFTSSTEIEMVPSLLSTNTRPQETMNGPARTHTADLLVARRNLSATLLSMIVVASMVPATVAFELPQAGSFVSPRRPGASASSRLSMFLDTTSKPRVLKPTTDTTKVGTLTLPNVGVGTISWSSDNLMKLENVELQKLVSTAGTMNAGFYDTAERYGSNLKTAIGMGWGETESLLSKLLTDTQSNGIVATKFTPSPWRTTVQSVVDACEQSRQRLGVEQIDLYQLHMPDIVQPLRAFGQEKVKDKVYWDGMAECYHRGMIKNVGVCNYGPTLLMQCQDHLSKRGVPLVSNQIAYSLLGRHNGAQETVDTCNEMGVQVLAFFPFAMGLLTGKYSSDSKLVLTEDDMLSLTQSKKTRLEERDLQRYAGRMGSLLEVMETIAKRRNKTVAQVALNYIICKGAIPIPGARTNAQLTDNLGALGWRLSKSEIGQLEAATDALGFGFEGAGFKRTSEKFVGYGVERWVLE